jgi:cobalt-zinc-cadmium efflux system outer membrane protein
MLRTPPNRLQLLVLGAFLTATSARAQADLPGGTAPTLPSPLGLRDALQIFERRGLDLLIADTSVQSAQADLAVAGAVPNPQISGSLGRSFDCAPSQDCRATSYSIGLADGGAISALLTGKRGLRKDAAAAVVEASRRLRDDARRTLTFSLEQAYVQALLAQALLQNARETRESYISAARLIERRYTAGSINEGELARAEVASLEAEQAVDQAEQNLRAAKASLAFMLGFRTLVPDFELDGKELEYVVPDRFANVIRETLLAQALEQRPDLHAQKAQETRAAAGLTLARRNRIPDFTLSATYSANGSGETNISPPNVSLGLALPLPVFYFQSGEVAKAEADLAAQRLQSAKAEAQVVADVDTAYGQFTTARRLVERMASALLDRARMARDITRVQYEKGAASLLELLDAQRTYTATRAEQLQALASYWIALAQLEQATATELRQ